MRFAKAMESLGDEELLEVVRAEVAKRGLIAQSYRTSALSPVRRSDPPPAALDRVAIVKALALGLFLSVLGVLIALAMTSTWKTTGRAAQRKAFLTWTLGAAAVGLVLAMLHR